MNSCRLLADGLRRLLPAILASGLVVSSVRGQEVPIGRQAWIRDERLKAGVVESRQVELEEYELVVQRRFLFAGTLLEGESVGGLAIGSRQERAVERGTSSQSQH